MKEYQKIETLFLRDNNGTKKLIEGAFRNDTVRYLQNVQWIFTEKIDGTNIRVHWDGHKVEFGGRTDTAQIPVHLMNFLIEKFGGMETEELFEQKFGDTEVTLYGEGYGKKIQKVGELYRNDVSFILFDVIVGEKLWLERHSVEEIAQAFGVDVVPIVGQGNLSDAVDFVKSKPMSTIGNAPMEGVVARPEVTVLDREGKRVIVKVKVKDFE